MRKWLGKGVPSQQDEKGAHRRVGGGVTADQSRVKSSVRYVYKLRKTGARLLTVGKGNHTCEGGENQNNSCDTGLKLE